MNDTQAYLLAVRTLLADPECWTQREYARDNLGRPVVIYSPRAVCWCIAGGLQFIAEHSDVMYSWAALDSAAAKHGHSIAKFNDAPDTTHVDVLALIDEAIEIAGETK